MDPRHNNNPPEATEQPKTQDSGIDRRFELTQRFFPTGWTETQQRFLPDYNPATSMLFSMPGQTRWGGMQPFDPNGDILTRILDLENNSCGVLYSLNNASISAVCNTDSTITITLNLPSLPAVC